MFANAFGNSIILGSAQAVDTLAAQAFGAANYPRVGLIAQRGIAVSLAFCFPVALAWYNAGPLLKSLGQAEDVTDLCSGYLRLLQGQGQQAQLLQDPAFGGHAVQLSRPCPVDRLPGFAQGWASVQDAAAQRAAPLLLSGGALGSPLPVGARVLDACAAPGGKTGHLLELANCDVLALDHDEQRLNRVSDNLKRLSLDAKLQVGDARSRDWWDGQPYDRILADLPCTASGIVRRHPDIRWLRRPEDSQQLAKRSAEILDNLWGMLRPGGLLLIVTCSVWPEESELQAQAFVHRQNAERLDAPGQLLPQADEASDHDGLFYALLRKPAL
jgi:16S rRNA (cytosine967-C5)-methyltransferase